MEPDDTPATASADDSADASSDDSSDVSSAASEPEWRRRRRLAQAFGDSTPDQTSDDRDPREDRSGKGDDWYRDQVPPHHG